MTRFLSLCVMCVSALVCTARVSGQDAERELMRAELDPITIVRTTYLVARVISSPHRVSFARDLHDVLAASAEVRRIDPD